MELRLEQLKRRQETSGTWFEGWFRLKCVTAILSWWGSL